eukprot:TRINITY_DN56596_c0_g1_i1.p1 TRINITY_DN56596_c0_g1~~TRINITY_DN56596_c0_g1_i1.p1  ORF type:complete len:494 (-),score=70.42 TRINITY_DN56596_c0_g1_i1:375-1769(-)
MQNVWGDDVLAPVFRCLHMPWGATQVAPVCRAWCILLARVSDCWADIAPSRIHLASLPALMLRCGERLRRLDLSRVGHGAETLTGVGAAFLACPHVEDLNVAGWEQLTFADSPSVCATFAQSLRRLNVRDCRMLHRELPSILGSPLRHLEAGWLKENDDSRDMNSWVRIFPRRLVHTICHRCPSLVTLRVPGYILVSRGTNAQERRAAIEDFDDLFLLAGLKQLHHLDLCCVQHTPLGVFTRIAHGCTALRNLNLRCNQSLTDGDIIAISQSLQRSLSHINISCCDVSEEAVRQLVVRCPGLLTLDLCYCRNISIGIVAFICADASLCPRLRMLGIGGFDVGDEEVVQLCAKFSSSLMHLGIGSASRLTDEGLRCLANLPHLRRLSAHRLSGISARVLADVCTRAPALVAIDTEGSEFSPEPTPEEQKTLKQVLDRLPYSYDSDTESDMDIDVDVGPQLRLLDS